MTFANQQPKAGDVILHCAHAVQAKSAHWFKIGEMEFQRPDGSRGKSEWVMLCNQCYATYELSEKKLEDMTFLITGDSELMGDEPAIKVNPNRPEEKLKEQ